MMLIKLSRVLLIFIGLVILPLSAEEVTEPIESDLKEEVEVALVQLSILATDKQGRAVTDLEVDEIRVKVDGMKMRVAYLEPFEVQQREYETPVEARLFIELPGGWGSPSAAGTHVPERLLIFIDIENDDRLQKEAALVDCLEFIRNDLDPETLVAVMSYNGELHEDLPFTRNRSAIETALRQAWSRAPRPQLDVNARITALVDQIEDCVSNDQAFTKEADSLCLRSVAIDYTEERIPPAKEYLAALKTMIQYVGGIRGHKTILAISHGLEIDSVPVILEAARAILGPTEQLGQLQLYLGFGDSPTREKSRLMKLAVRNKVTLHFVDRNRAPTSDTGVRRNSNFQAGTQPVTQGFVTPQIELRDIAAATGGLFVASRDLHEGLQQVMAAQAGGYELGYYLDVFLTPKELNKTKVRTTRKKTRISHRKGYYVPSLTESGGVTGRLVVGAGTRATAEQQTVHYPLSLEIDPREIGYQIDGDAAAASFTLHFLIQNLTGTTLVDSFHFINHAYPRQLWEAGDIEPVIITGWAELPPGDYNLVAVVRNAETGDAGEFKRTVQLADVKAESPATKAN